MEICRQVFSVYIYIYIMIMLCTYRNKCVCVCVSVSVYTLYIYIYYLYWVFISVLKKDTQRVQMSSLSNFCVGLIQDVSQLMVSGILSASALLYIHHSGGDMKKVEDHMRRSRGSMNDLLRLVEVPTLEDPGEVEKEEQLRNTPLAGEVDHIWAIEGDEGPSSRQQLPLWVAKPIQKEVCWFTERSQHWDAVIEGRNGKPLPPKQLQLYNDWQEQCADLKMLFNIKSQCRVTKLNSKAQLKNVTRDMFSLRLELNRDASKLRIRTGAGASKRLVVLEGEPIPDQDCPFLHSAGLDADVLDEMKKGASGHDFEAGEDDTGDHGATVDEHEALIQADEDAVMPYDEPNDTLEICANTSDEDVPEGNGSVSVKKVKDFAHRAEYVKLSSLGLTMLPIHRPGVFLSFHKTTRCWQAFYPGVSSGLSFSFGGSTNSALEAFDMQYDFHVHILSALLLMSISWLYVQITTNDKYDKYIYIILYNYIYL